jgi:hypothetical protein
LVASDADAAEDDGVSTYVRQYISLKAYYTIRIAEFAVNAFNECFSL